MNRLTARQQAIYDFIRECMISRGYGPTVREIGHQMDIRSPNGVMCHLRALEKKGVIHRLANKSRAIELSEPLQRTEIRLEVQGWLVNGTIEKRAGESKRIELVQELSGDQNFLIEVADDSLQPLNICQGDQIVIRKFGVVSPGQIVLVHLSDPDELFLGQIHRQGSRLLVVRWTDNSVAFSLRDVDIIGVAIGVLRLFAHERYPIEESTTPTATPDQFG